MIRDALQLAADRLGGEPWPEEVQVAAGLLAAEFEHQRICGACGSVDEVVAAGVPSVLASPFRGSLVDEEVMSAVIELAAVVGERPRMCERVFAGAAG